jgi:hypothetical protein
METNVECCSKRKISFLVPYTITKFFYWLGYPCFVDFYAVCLLLFNLDAFCFLIFQHFTKWHISYFLFFNSCIYEYMCLLVITPLVLLCCVSILCECKSII